MAEGKGYAAETMLPDHRPHYGPPCADQDALMTISHVVATPLHVLRLRHHRACQLCVVASLTTKHAKGALCVSHRQAERPGNQ